MTITTRSITSPEWPFHEVTHGIPAMSLAEYCGLLNSIQQHGLIDPILLDDKGEKIIDGRHRYMACEELGVPPVYLTWDGVGDMRSVVRARNVRRRHINQSQAAIIARKAIPLLQKYGFKETRDAKAGQYMFTRKTIQEAASCMGVSETDVRHAIFLEKHGVPELDAAVFKGAVPLLAAALVAAHYPRKRQMQIAAGGRAAVGKAVKEILDRQSSGTRARDLLPSFGADNTKSVITDEQQALWLKEKREKCASEGRDMDWAETLSEMSQVEVIEL